MQDATRSGWRRFFGLPSTPLGWASIGLLAAFFVLVIVGQGLNLIDTRWLNLALLLSSLLAALGALIFKRDRSWLVWIPVVFAVFAFGGEVVQALLGGE